MSTQKRYKRTTFDLVTVMCSEDHCFTLPCNVTEIMVIKNVLKKFTAFQLEHGADLYYQKLREYNKPAFKDEN